MSDLRDLYQQVILDHNRSPRNFRKLEEANRTAEGSNPLCGDTLTVYLKVENGVIHDLGFQGSGCAISQASASLMTMAVKGKTVDEATSLFRAFHRMVTAAPSAPVEGEALGKLAVFGGVRQFPVRVKCANLPWHTLRAALDCEVTEVSTENPQSAGSEREE